MKKIFWMLVAAAFAGCGDDNGAEAPAPAERLALSAETLAFDADGGVLSGGTNEVSVASSGPWRLSGRQEWCVPSVDKGGDGETVAFAVEPNTDLDTREVRFTFMCGGEERRLTVTQEGGSLLDPDQTDYSLPAEGGEFRLRIESSGETSCRFLEPVDWIHRVETRASLSFFYFTADANTTGRPRDARLVVTNTDGDERTVTVRQERNLLLEVGETSFNIPVEGGEVRVNVRSNLPFRADPTVDWIVLQTPPSSSEELLEQELVFKIEAAEVPFRSGFVRFTTDEESLSAEVSVVQGERPKGIEFPDDTFRQILVDAGYITVLDGTECILTETGEAATQLPDLYRKGIASLKGIEAFANLTTLEPNGIGENPIRELDLSGNAKLTTIGWQSVLGGWRSYLTPAPLEVLKLGDAPVEEGRVVLSSLYCSSPYETSESLTVSGTAVRIIEITLGSYDKVQWLDITGCPAIQSVTLNSYYLKTLYVTAGQKSAIDAQRIVINDQNYPTSQLEIKVR